MPASFALPAAFFLSGAAGLMFQVVWLYRCGLVLGSSLPAVTVVLSAFMAGVGAGSAAAARAGDRVAHPIRAYITLELLVAITGIAVSVLLSHVGAVVGRVTHLTTSAATLNAARLAIAFGLLIVPAGAMGATLPLLVSVLAKRGAAFGPALGRLYGWNTLGAVVGVIGAEVLFIGAAGVTGTACAAAGLNLCAALLAGSIRSADADEIPNAGHQQDEQRAGTPQDRGAVRWLLLSTAVAGGALLGLEVVWFRFLSMYVLVTTLATSVMLAAVLSGIGVGGIVGAIWLGRGRNAATWLAVLACATGLSVIGSFTLFSFVTQGTQVGAWTSVLWFACELTVITSLLSGALFTLTGDALHRTGLGAAEATGSLALANTLGAIVGPALATWVLLPNLGIKGSITTFALAYGIVGALAALGLRVRRAPIAMRRVPSLVMGAVLAVGVALLPLGAADSAYFLRAAAAYADDGSEVVATREGTAETLFVMQQRWLGRPVYSRLVTNGFSMSGTALQGQRYMRGFAYYPMLFHDGPLRNALVVCYGVGVTVGAVTHIPSVETIDVVEISREIPELSDVIYEAGSRPLEDPRVRLHTEDGRFFLQTTADAFDLITGEPPPPRTPGTVNIYTREYFELVRSRLREGGIATYWVPVARPNPGTDVNTIVKAFCDVFSDCSLWNATPFDLMLVGSRGTTGPRSLADLSRPWQTPGLEARLREVALERPEQIGATFIGDAAYLKTLTQETPPLVDDFPQRLRPHPGRPSLSDPGYGRDQAVTTMYDSVLSVERARTAFSTSAFVRGLFPPDLIERSLPYFEQQRIINRVYWEGGQPLRQIEDLDGVLSGTTLRTLPLWILGSDEVKQRIAETTRDDVSGAVEYARALRALSGRDFAGASRWLSVALERGFTGPTASPLLAYASMKSGNTVLAQQLAAAAHASSDDERHFWEWMGKALDGRR